MTNDCQDCKHFSVMGTKDNHYRVQCSFCGNEVIYGMKEHALGGAKMLCRNCDHRQERKDEPRFWKPEKGKDFKVRLMKPDNVVVCTDNSGIEGQFDEGVEYIFESRSGDMISVYDNTGTLRECFAERFEVKSSSEIGVKYHFAGKDGRLPAHQR